jgi:hypothetical protein
VIPHFVGEIGLNTDILQLAHRVFARTKRIGVGSAIMNILCNGGPIAAAERIKTFLALHGLDENERRILTIGFASGRFPFINIPYGIVPRNAVEEAAWPVVKNKIFEEATEIRASSMARFSARRRSRRACQRGDLRGDADWQRVIDTHGQSADEVPLAPRWVFPTLKIAAGVAWICCACRSVTRSRDADLANTIRPNGVFNLPSRPATRSSRRTPHARALPSRRRPMGAALCSRTVLVFINDDPEQARAEAKDGCRTTGARSAHARRGESPPRHEQRPRRRRGDDRRADAERFTRTIG